MIIMRMVLIHTKMVDKKKQGKKNKAAGARFELKVRKDLEKDSWIVDKWNNNVDLIIREDEDMDRYLDGKLIIAKRKYNPHKKVMAIGVGFPDFICFRIFRGYMSKAYEVIGVEVKSNGYLDPTEREKCKWLLENNVFSKILIAQKGTKRGQIVYKEFEGP